MEKENTSAEKKVNFRLAGKLNIFFIILIFISAIPLAIGFIGMFDQFTQPIIFHSTMTVYSSKTDTIDLESDCIYYITIEPAVGVPAGDFTGTLSFFKETEEIYKHTIQHTIRTGQKGAVLSFEPFISDVEGSYTVNCVMTFSDITHQFYIKMQRATEVAQITGYSGEEILGMGMIVFIAVMVLLIIVSLIARVHHTIQLGRFVGGSEQAKAEESQDKFVWKSKDGNEDS